MSSFFLVRKPHNLSSTSYPGVVQRIDNNLNSKTSLSSRSINYNHPISSLKTNSTRANLITMSEIDQQKENKFKQIFDQSTIDLGKHHFFIQIEFYSLYLYIFRKTS